MLRDSGLTDSQFMEAQKMVQGRHKEISKEYDLIEDRAKQKILKERFEQNAKKPQAKTSLWDKVTGLFK